MGLRAKVCERVDALANEVETVRVPLIVEVFELDTELKEKLMSKLELFLQYLLLVDEPDALNELAEVPVSHMRITS